MTTWIKSKGLQSLFPVFFFRLVCRLSTRGCCRGGGCRSLELTGTLLSIELLNYFQLDILRKDTILLIGSMKELKDKCTKMITSETLKYHL